MRGTPAESVADGGELSRVSARPEDVVNAVTAASASTAVASTRAVCFDRANAGAMVKAIASDATNTANPTAVPSMMKLRAR